MAVNPIPEDYPRVIPYLNVDDADAAIAWYGEVLGTTEKMRMPGTEGKIGHAEIELGPAVIMLADVFPDIAHQTSPSMIGGTSVTLMVYVEDVDATFAKALAAGAKELRPLEDQFYGDRSGQFQDPWGHHWYVASHIEDVSDEEMVDRAAAAAAAG